MAARFASWLAAEFAVLVKNHNYYNTDKKHIIYADELLLVILTHVFLMQALYTPMRFRLPCTCAYHCDTSNQESIVLECLVWTVDKSKMIICNKFCNKSVKIRFVATCQLGSKPVDNKF